MSRRLTVRLETWPLASAFRISRGAKTEAHVVVAEIADGPHTGRGEAVPYPRYDETPEGTRAEIEGLRDAVEGGLTREGPVGGAAAGRRPQCAGLRALGPGGEAGGPPGLGAGGPGGAAALHHRRDAQPRHAGEHGRGRRPPRALPLLKLKVTGKGDLARIEAVRANAPGARLIVDANEGWTVPMLEDFPAGLRRPRGRDGGAAAAGGGRRRARRPAIRDPALRR